MLNSLEALKPPPGGHVFIAIDNAGDGASRRLLDAYVERLPLLVLAEPEKGKNRAINRALEALEADCRRINLVVFTDDDVIVAPDWLCAFERAALAHPGHDIFGGCIEPEWLEAPPAWIEEFRPQFASLYSITSLSDGPCQADDLFGSNFAIRGEALAGARFNVSYGPNGTSRYPMGSETEFLQRMMSEGKTARFVADSVVRHMINPFQIQESWIFGRAYRHGIGVGMRDRGRFSILTNAWFGVRTYATVRVKIMLGPLLGLKTGVRTLNYGRHWAKGYLRGLVNGVRDQFRRSGNPPK